MFKKTVAIILLTTFFLTVFSYTANADSFNSNEKMISNNGFLLNETTGDFTVKYEDYIWKSSPIFDGFDENAPGIEQSNQRSLLLIEYLDDSGNFSTTNSYIDSFKMNGIKITNGDNKAIVTFYFPDLEIGIPLEFEYKNNSLKVKVDTKKIAERGACKLLSVTILPYFASAPKGDDGYIMIPDGSGSLISLKETNAYNKFYEKDVYGENSVLNKETKTTVEKQIYLPVFGIRHNNNSILGIISEGDGIAKITANIASSYYTVAPKFIYREHDESRLQAGSSSEKVVEIYPKNVTKSNFSVTYIFNNGENSDYVGMASSYRDFLIKQKKIKKSANGSSLDLNFIATAEISKNFLGIPYIGIETLTSFDDILKVAEKLNESGSKKPNIAIKGALSGGIYGKKTNAIKLINKVGSVKKYQSIKKEMSKIDGKFFLLSDLIHVYKSGNGVSFAKDTARDVSGAISKQYNYYPENFAKNENLEWKLINASALEKLSSKLSKSIKKTNVSFGLLNSANELYGDYRINEVNDRQTVLKAMIKSYKTLSKTANGMYFDGANVYAMPYADVMSNIPLKSSQYDMFTEDVPFYQLVMHGITDYSSTPINLSGDIKYFTLKSIEYGASLRYDLACQNTDLIHSTTAKSLFSGDYNTWIKKILETESEISSFYSENSDSHIVSHKEVAENVYETMYDNGNKSIVNYNNSDVTIDYLTIKAKDFVLIKKGN